MKKPFALVLAVLALACGTRPGASVARLGTAAASAIAATARSHHTATLLTDGRVLVAGGRSDAGALGSCELVDPAASVVTPAAPLGTARHDHTATVLADGRVLIAGGLDPAGQPLASTEIFDPGPGTWTPGPSLAAARAGHTATRLVSGAVLVTGGRGATGVLATSERLPADRSAWATAGALGGAREAHAAALLADGTVLVAGGDDGGALAAAERYDPATDSWAPTGALAAARASLVLVRLADGRVLAAGGEDAGGALASSEVFDPSGGVWSPASPLVNARAGASAVLLPSGEAAVVGGRAAGSELASVERLDPATLSWTEAAPLAAARAGHTVTLLPGARALVWGGAQGGNALTVPEVLDLASPAWAVTGPTSTSRRGHTSTLLPDGSVLVAGGVDGLGGYLANAQLFEPATGLWRDTGSMLVARTDHTATLLESGEVLVVGGSVGSGAALAAAELYDPVSGTWRFTGGLHLARAGHTATLLPSGAVLVAGGETSGIGTLQVTSAVEAYDPGAGAFVLGNSMAAPRARHTATRLPGGDVLVTGGEDAAGSLPGCELWSSWNWTWTPRPALGRARARHAATLLDDGRVLVTGGFGTGGALAESELGSIALGFALAAPMAQARGDHAAVLLPTGEVLVAGGRGAADVASAERWDPATSSWKQLPDLSRARRGLTLTVLPDGRVLAAGGDAGAGAHVGEVLDAGLSGGVAGPALDPGLPARVPGTPLLLPGAGLAGGPEASGGGVNASATDHPVLRLEGAAGPVVALGVSAFSATSVTGAVPPGTSPGWYWVRPFASGVAGAARPLLVIPALRISPRTAWVVPGGSVAFVAAGGFGYVWTLDAAPSGASIDATGLYRAGSRGGVTDVVRVTDALGNTATAAVGLGASLAIGDNPGGADPGETIAFTASGGSGAGFAWSLAPGSSGSSIDPVTGVYTAGDERNASDLVRVTDSLGNVAEVTVYVWPEWKLGGDGCSCGTGGLSGSPLALLLAALALRTLGRRRLPRGARVAIFAALCAAGSAQAQESSTAVVVERFEPLGGALDVLGVGSAKVLGHLERGAGVSVSYASQPLRLTAPGDLTFAVVEQQSTVAMGGSVGLFGWLEVAAVASGSAQVGSEAPNVPPSMQPSFASKGLSDLRLVPKLALGSLGPVRAAFSVPVTLPTGDSGSFLGADAATYAPRLLLEGGGRGLRLLGSAGYAIRPEQELLGATVGSAIIYGIAAEVPLRRFAVQASLVGEKGTSSAASPLEALLGVRWRGVRGLAVTVGGGPGISSGYGTPRWRGFVMLTFDSLDPVRTEAPVLPEPPPVPLAELAEPPPAPVVQGRRAPTSVPLPPPPLTTLDARVYFAVNEAALPERFQTEIGEVAATVRANPRPVRIVVEGHADEIGNPRHNRALSMRRAEAVRDALREAGVPAERLRAVGYGDSRPAVPGRHAMNRRVELRVE